MLEYLVGGWLVCAAVAAIVGSARNAGGKGFLLGLLLGPLGILAAFAIDGREQCPHCGGRLNGRPQLCQHCQSHLDWPTLPGGGQLTGEFGLRCSRCKHELPLSLESAGERVECPACGKLSKAQTFAK